MFSLLEIFSCNKMLLFGLAFIIFHSKMLCHSCSTGFYIRLCSCSTFPIPVPRIYRTTCGMNLHRGFLQYCATTRNAFKTNARLKLAKIRQKLSNTLRLNFWQTCPINKLSCVNEIMWLIVMKVKMIKKTDHINKM